LGDERLRRRLQLILARFGAQPERSVPLACPGGAEMHGAYRFFQHQSVTPARVLGGHQAATLARMAPLARVLCVGDSTFLNYAGQRATVGLGPHTGDLEYGFLLHPLVAFSPAGLCLGTLHWQSWARDPALGKRRTRHLRPIEQKESRCWGDELRTLDLWREALPRTELLYIADRESDIYELLAQTRAPGVDLLIRAVRNRKTTDGSRLWAEAASWPLSTAGRQSLAVAARPGRPARTAEVELRWGEVELTPPARPDRRLPPVRLRVVWVREAAAPPGAEPLEWMLLTSLSVPDAAAAWQIVEHYRQRWQIERFFHVLKQGCRVEALQLQTRARLEAAVAVYLIVAYRILHLQGRAKAEPSASALTAFNPEECLALGQLHRPRLAPEALDLREATRRLARLGGYTARASDGPPGLKTLWLGWQRLSDFIVARRLFAHLPPLV
jgi:transposase